MTNRQIAQAEAEVAAARLALRVAELKLARAEDPTPPEPRAAGTTLRIKVQYREGETVYTYIALKVPATVQHRAGWLLTGQRYAGKVLTWDEVVHLADKNYAGRAHFEDIT